MVSDENEEHTLNDVNKQEKKVALVTGAARRIGAAIVKRLHQAGYQVGIHCYHSAPEAQALADDLNRQCEDSARVLVKELSTEQSSMELIEALIQWTGRLDLLVNNASIFTRTDCEHFDEVVWNTVFTTNVKIPFLLSLAAKPYLAAKRGVIINLTDIHAEKPLRGYSVYCQSKAALVMQTKTLAQAFAPEVRVNAIAPGAIAWPEGPNSLSPEIQKKISLQTPLKQHGDPNFIAQAVLALTENAFITGQILNVDGGRSIN